MLKVLHSSDLHGKYKRLLNGCADTEFDVWLDTGDFLDNVGRVPKTNMQIVPHTERGYQLRWIGYKQLAHRFKDWLDGRPAILVPGNHDFLTFAHHLKRVCPNVHAITPAGVEVAGLTWAGFRQINHEEGEWEGEIEPEAFAPLVDQTFDTNPDVLVTHAPPEDILSRDGFDEEYGIAKLAAALREREHRIRWHFFGHAHPGGGSQVELDGVQHINGACNTIVHTIG